MACPEETMAGPSTRVGEDGQEGSGGPGMHLGGGEKGSGEEAQGRPDPEQGESDALICI